MVNPIGNQIVAGGQVQLAQGGKISLAGNQIIQVGASGAGPHTTSAQGIKVGNYNFFFFKFLHFEFSMNLMTIAFPRFQIGYQNMYRRSY